MKSIQGLEKNFQSYSTLFNNSGKNAWRNGCFTDAWPFSTSTSLLEQVFQVASELNNFSSSPSHLLFTSRILMIYTH